MRSVGHIVDTHVFRSFVELAQCALYADIDFREAVVGHGKGSRERGQSLLHYPQRTGHMVQQCYPLSGLFSKCLYEGSATSSFSSVPSSTRVTDS